jgi:hypothetical protein
VGCAGQANRGSDVRCLLHVKMHLTPSGPADIEFLLHHCAGTRQSVDFNLWATSPYVARDLQGREDS